MIAVIQAVCAQSSPISSLKQIEINKLQIILLRKSLQTIMNRVGPVFRGGRTVKDQLNIALQSETICAAKYR